MSDLMVATNPLEPKPVGADSEVIRRFVTELAGVSETVKDARDDMKEAVNSNELIMALDEQIKELRDERKEMIADDPVIQGYKDVLDDATEVKRQLISDAKHDGVPRKEIAEAIVMLKKDVDPELTTDIYSKIADLIE